MTDLAFAWPGRTAAKYAQTGLDDYLARIGRYKNCRVVITPAEKHGGKYSQEHRIEREGDALIKKLADLEPAWVCALDPAGKRLDTDGFAELLDRQLHSDTRTPVFVVGGPDGLSYAVQKRADRLLGLSPWTLPHDMARLVLVEQVYRALTILNGHPYDR